MDTEGYIADAEVLIDIVNPRGSTSMRPRLRFQEFPDRDDLQRIESFFDLHSDYRWERSTLLADLNYSLRDVYNTETLGGDFDPDNPDSPDNPEAGNNHDRADARASRAPPRLRDSTDRADEPRIRRAIPDGAIRCR